MSSKNKLLKLGFKKVKEPFTQEDIKPYMSPTTKDMISGLAGGAVSTTTVFPMDTLTTRAQAKHLLDKPPKTRLGKFVALYKGLPYKLLKAAPGMMVTFGTVGGTRRVLDNYFTSKKPKKEI